MGVDCLRVVSRVKDLKQWASVSSAKSLYKEWLREVKGDKAQCIVCMKYVDILGMGESALTTHDHLKGNYIKH